MSLATNPITQKVLHIFFVFTYCCTYFQEMVQIEMAWMKEKKSLYARILYHFSFLVHWSSVVCSLPTEGFNHGHGLIAEECSIAKVILRELTRDDGGVVDEGSGRCWRCSISSQNPCHATNTQMDTSGFQARTSCICSAITRKLSDDYFPLDQLRTGGYGFLKTYLQ